MAYGGYLLKIGDYTVPTSIIKADSYSAYENMQDVDPWTDANGYLHRTAVTLKAIKVEFETHAGMYSDEFDEFMENVQKQFANSTERGCYITAYIPQTRKYVTQYGYMADIEPSIYGVFDGKIMYNACKFSFIGGVYNG